MLLKQRDLGNPLMCQTGGEWRLYGVASFATRCNMSIPSVFTKLTTYKNWINQEAGILKSTLLNKNKMVKKVVTRLNRAFRNEGSRVNT